MLNNLKFFVNILGTRFLGSSVDFMHNEHVDGPLIKLAHLGFYIKQTQKNILLYSMPKRNLVIVLLFKCLYNVLVS
jgi:hypothetical protein